MEPKAKTRAGEHQARPDVFVVACLFDENLEQCGEFIAIAEGAVAFEHAVGHSVARIETLRFAVSLERATKVAPAAVQIADQLVATARLGLGLTIVPQLLGERPKRAEILAGE
ncbi:MAG: hypothetical protein WEB63_09680 [Cucumibacter sp.]